jgi:hypothetical protein
MINQQRNLYITAVDARVNNKLLKRFKYRAYLFYHLGQEMSIKSASLKHFEDLFRIEQQDCVVKQKYELKDFCKEILHSRFYLSS